MNGREEGRAGGWVSGTLPSHGQARMLLRPPSDYWRARPPSPAPPPSPEASGLATHLDGCHGPALGGSLPGAFQAFLQGLVLSPLWLRRQSCLLRLTPGPPAHSDLLPPHLHPHFWLPLPPHLPTLDPSLSTAPGSRTDWGSGLGRSKTHVGHLYASRDSHQCHLPSLTSHLKNGNSKVSQEQTGSLCFRNGAKLRRPARLPKRTRTPSGQTQLAFSPPRGSPPP